MAARLALIAALLGAPPLAAQQMPTEKPGAADLMRVKAGAYTVEPLHTEILFEVDHLGFNSYWGIFHSATGTLTIDPKAPAAAKVEISVPLANLVTTTPLLNEHLMKPDFFDAAKYPIATFRSTKVTPSGKTARIDGLLTLHGVTRPITLAATYTGAGLMPMMNTQTIGFSATTSIRRSDFGITYGTALVSDVVPLRISVAFEKK